MYISTIRHNFLLFNWHLYPNFVKPRQNVKTVQTKHFKHLNSFKKEDYDIGRQQTIKLLSASLN